MTRRRGWRRSSSAATRRSADGDDRVGVVRSDRTLGGAAGEGLRPARRRRGLVGMGGPDGHPLVVGAAGGGARRAGWGGRGEGGPGGVGAIRRLGLGALSSRKEIVEYAAPRLLAYAFL